MISETQNTNAFELLKQFQSKGSRKGILVKGNVISSALNFAAKILVEIILVS
jgi:hypothetical protein